MNRPTGRIALATAIVAFALISLQATAKETIPTKPVLSYSAGVSLVWDSNIDRNQAEVSDWGTIPMFGVQWVKKSGIQKFGLSYEGANHNYHDSPQWNRYSQQVNGLWEVNWSRRWRSQTLLELTFKGSSDDRALSNRYSLIERIDYDITDKLNGRLYGAWQVRAKNAEPGRDGDDPYVGVTFTQKLSKSHEIDVDVRYEDYRAEALRNKYQKTSYSVQYKGKLGDANQLAIELKYRDQYYERLIDVGDELVRRQDERYLATLSLGHRFAAHWEGSMNYEFERRDSNDPKKEYDGHYLGTTLLYRW